MIIVYDIILGEMNLPVLPENLKESFQMDNEKYDIVVANILADVIIMLVKEIPVHLKKGGYFITSGIINLKEEAVRAAFAASEELVVVEITYQGEWLSVTARKK